VTLIRYALYPSCPGLSRLKDGVPSHAHVPGIHVLTNSAPPKDVDGRDEPGHDRKTPSEY